MYGTVGIVVAALLRLRPARCLRPRRALQCRRPRRRRRQGPGARQALRFSLIWGRAAARAAPPPYSSCSSGRGRAAPARAIAPRRAHHSESAGGSRGRRGGCRQGGRNSPQRPLPSAARCRPLAAAATVLRVGCVRHSSRTMPHQRRRLWYWQYAFGTDSTARPPAEPYCEWAGGGQPPPGGWSRPHETRQIQTLLLRPLGSAPKRS